MDAAQRGAASRPRTELISARREGNIWHAELSHGVPAKARVLANAAGPWVTETLARLRAGRKARVRLVRGSHIIGPRLYEGDRAYILQQPDRRITFAIPHEACSTLIATHGEQAGRPPDPPVTGNRTAERWG